MKLLFITQSEYFVAKHRIGTRKW